MKFIAIFVILAALFAVVLADVRPTPPRRCDFKCTNLDGNICATNGICLHLFPSLCLMDRYNCLFPQKSFKRADDWKCTEKALPLCTKAEL